MMTKILNKNQFAGRNNFRIIGSPDPDGQLEGLSRRGGVRCWIMARMPLVEKLMALFAHWILIVTKLGKKPSSAEPLPPLPELPAMANL